MYIPVFYSQLELHVTNSEHYLVFVALYIPHKQKLVQIFHNFNISRPLNKPWYIIIYTQ